jgi:hypothetical protein
MNSKKKIALIALAVIVVLGGVAVYLFTIGPFGNPSLATVNGERITIVSFQKELGKIDPSAQDLIKEDPSQLLDFIVNRTLLLQQAKKAGVIAPEKGTAVSPAEPMDHETAMIMAFLDKKMAALPPIPQEAVEQIYEAYKGQMVGRKKEEVLPARCWPSCAGMPRSRSMARRCRN